ncbi:THAP domain-containing protein 1-like, partial [Aphis craccivora]
NKEITKKWIDAIQVKGFVPTYYSRICSKHFTHSDFKNIYGQRLHLNPDAVPSVFCSKKKS